MVDDRNQSFSVPAANNSQYLCSFIADLSSELCRIRITFLQAASLKTLPLEGVKLNANKMCYVS